MKNKILGTTSFFIKISLHGEVWKTENKIQNTIALVSSKTNFQSKVREFESKVSNFTGLTAKTNNMRILKWWRIKHQTLLSFQKKKKKNSDTKNLQQ